MSSFYTRLNAGQHAGYNLFVVAISTGRTRHAHVCDKIVTAEQAFVVVAGPAYQAYLCVLLSEISDIFIIIAVIIIV